MMTFKLVSRDETQESDQLKCNQLHVVQALCTSKFQTACCWHLKPCICYLPIYALSANGINSGACNCPSQLLRFSRPQTGHAACVRWVLVPALQASGVAHDDPDHIMSIESERSFLNELANLVLYLSTEDQKSVVDS